jgi:hypothetical protein
MKFEKDKPKQAQKCLHSDIQQLTYLEYHKKYTDQTVRNSQTHF